MAEFGQFGAVHCHGGGDICSAAERALAGCKQNRCGYLHAVILLH